MQLNMRSRDCRVLPFGTFKGLIPNKTIRGSTNTYWDAATQNGKARSEDELVRLEIGGDCCNPQ